MAAICRRNVMNVENKWIEVKERLQQGDIDNWHHVGGGGRFTFYIQFKRS